MPDGQPFCVPFALVWDEGRVLALGEIFVLALGVIFVLALGEIFVLALGEIFVLALGKIFVLVDDEISLGAMGRSDDYGYSVALFG